MKYIEFKKNDVVHWQKDDGKFIKAKVVAVGFGKRGCCFRKRINYDLRGISENLITIASPRFIKESIFFIDGYQAE